MLAPRDLTIPEAAAPGGLGGSAAREVLSAAMGRLGRELAAAPRAAPPAARAEALELLRLVQASMKSAQGALFSALRRPTVGALVRCLRGGASPGLYASLLGHLAFEMAFSGALSQPVRLRPSGRLLSLAGRVAVTLPADATGLVLDNERLTVERRGGKVGLELDAFAPGEVDGVRVERPYHAIAGDIVLALADNNPLAMMEAHPDKEGNAVDLGGRSPEVWTLALGEAMAKVERYLPALWAEMNLYVHQIVPVGYFDEKHLSASYQEAIGTIYCSLHPSEMTLAEALIHEFSHNKLNALFELDEVLENAWSPLYTSPVRPDPRPLHGVLLAVHAFLPVARLYERMIEEGDAAASSEAFRARYAAIRRINREGAEVLLANARPTAVGEGLLGEIRRWDAYYGSSL